MVPGNRPSLVIETGGYPVEETGPIHVVLDIFLAGPDDLHRPLYLHGDLHSAGDAVNLEPATEAAADQVIVNDDLVQRQSGGFCGSGLGSREGLVADPDFAAVLADMYGAVHRLHRRVREERNLIGRLDLGDSGRHSFLGIADVLRNRPRTQRSLFELAHDLVCVELGVRSVVPFDHQGRQPFLRGPHMVGYDRDGVVEPYDLTHALDSLGLRIIDALHATAENGRLREGPNLHARRPTA